MKNIIFRQLYLLGFIIFVAGCCGGKNDTILDIPTDQMLNQINGGTVVYKNQGGQTDSFRISVTDKMYDTRDNEDRCNTLTNYELRIFTFQPANSTENRNTYIRNMKFEASQINWQSATIVIDRYDSLYKTFRLNNREFTKVYRYKGSKILPDNANVTKLYFSYQFGVLQYETRSGEIWKLETAAK